jgi:hypothetical protein
VPVKVTARVRRAAYDTATNTARVVLPASEGVATDLTFTVGRRPNAHTGQDDITLFPHMTVDWPEAFIKVGAAPATVGHWIEPGIDPHELQFLK